MYLKMVDIPMVSYSDLTENCNPEGATESHRNWKVISGALIYERRIYGTEA
jgi:hypothetical protein